MVRTQDKVPPGNVSWDDFFQATDPATDPANEVGPGKRWVETDDDTAPTQIVAVHKRSPDNTTWIPYPMGSLAVGGDADTLDGFDSTDFVTQAEVGTAAALDVDTDGTLAANSDSVVPSQKAVKTAIQASLAGLSWKQAVRVATTSAGTLASSFENGDTVDGVTLATGNRILIKNQASGSENGIYTVNASGAPTRATDADTAAEILQATVYVEEGTANADTAWTMTTNAPITLNTTALVFAQFGAGTSYTADETTLHLASTVFSIKSGGVGSTELASTAVTPGSYGDASNVGQFTVDADGRITAAANVAITGGSGGGFTVTAIKTSTYTAAAGEFVRVDTSGGAFTVNLPSGHSAGDMIQVKMVGTGTNYCTVDANSTETIDGALTYLLQTQYEVVSLISDGTNWLVMA